jgi:ElaB/YqjD/DUF883 family membrane-anchored ribosome-binding protein
MPINERFGDKPLADQAETAGQRVAQAAHDARGAMSDAARTAGAKVDEGRKMAADRLEDAASTVRERADELPGGPRVQQFAHSAADRFEDTADYLRTADARQLRADVETMVRENPGPALLVAAAFGFVLGRAMTRN